MHRKSCLSCKTTPGTSELQDQHDGARSLHQSLQRALNLDVVLGSTTAMYLENNTTYENLGQTASVLLSMADEINEMKNRDRRPMRGTIVVVVVASTTAPEGVP